MPLFIFLQKAPNTICCDISSLLYNINKMFILRNSCLIWLVKGQELLYVFLNSHSMKFIGHQENPGLRQALKPGMIYRIIDFTVC